MTGIINDCGDAMKFLLCSVYKTLKKADTYLYVAKNEGFKRVPEPLLQMFGNPVYAMDIMVKPEKPLARIEGSRLISEIEEKGFYLQLPPPKEDYLLDLYDPLAEMKKKQDLGE